MMCGSRPEPDAVTASAGTGSMSFAFAGLSCNHISKNADWIAEPDVAGWMISFSTTG